MELSRAYELLLAAAVRRHQVSDWESFQRERERERQREREREKEETETVGREHSAIEGGKDKGGREREIERQRPRDRERAGGEEERK